MHYESRQPSEDNRIRVLMTQKAQRTHAPRTTAMKAERTLSPYCSAIQNRGWMHLLPLPFAITHQLLLRSIYHPLLIENTHPL